MAAKKNKALKKISSPRTAAGGAEPLDGADPSARAAHQFGFASEDETQLAALAWKLGAAKARVIVDHVERIKSALRG